MTLPQLKEILDKGGMIMNGDKKCWWANGTYHYYNGRDWHFPFDDLISFISDPSEWSEVKPFAPRMIVKEIE